MSRKCAACGEPYTIAMTMEASNRGCRVCGCKDWTVGGGEDYDHLPSVITLHLARWELDGIEWALNYLVERMKHDDDTRERLRIVALRIREAQKA